MSSALARNVLRRTVPRVCVPTGRRAASDAMSTTRTGQEFDKADKDKSEMLKNAPKRDPELYILGGIMTAAFAGAGYYFASKPTSSTSESRVNMVLDSQPWQSGTSGKYQYHPDGDRTRAPKDAPSALHSVVVPDVNLPKHLHELFNKYDDEEYDDY